MSQTDAIRALVADEIGIRTAVISDAGVARLVASMAERPGVRAILFYGARRRAGAERGGPLDFYVLTDGDVAYHGAGLSALANRLLPPNVYFERVENPAPAEAKVAVIRMAAFRARMRPRSWDTTLWARFSQPVTLVWARDDAARGEVADALSAAIETAGWWAAHLSPPAATPLEAWRTLYAATYAAELRVEGPARAGHLVEASAARYATLHTLAVAPHHPPEDHARRRIARSWAGRQRIGKLLNVARLLKAAFTYRRGLAYALSKVERHSGAPVALSPWQRRWPWLAAPVVAWRLWREGRLR